jgi:hypothetical protein
LVTFSYVLQLQPQCAAATAAVGAEEEEAGAGAGHTSTDEIGPKGSLIMQWSKPDVQVLLLEIIKKGHGSPCRPSQPHAAELLSLFSTSAEFVLQSNHPFNTSFDHIAGPILVPPS